MADLKITQLTELLTAPATNDLFEMVDISDVSMAPSGTNKKITWANLTSALAKVGTGTLNRVPIFTGVNTIGDSNFQQTANSFEPVASSKNLGADTVNGRWSNIYTAGNLIAQDGFTIQSAGTNVAYFRDSGKVGIRESNPSAVFEVKGIGSGSNFATIIKDSADSTLFDVREDGRIGIGTTTHSAKLEMVAGSTKPALITSTTQSDLFHLHSNGLVLHSAVSPEAAFQVRSNASSPGAGRAMKIDTFNVFGALIVEPDGSKFMANQAAPAGTPAFGGYLYVVAGGLFYKGSSGTVTNIAVA